MDWADRYAAFLPPLCPSAIAPHLANLISMLMICMLVQHAEDQYTYQV
jgi:hypothetical protein